MFEDVRYLANLFIQFLGIGMDDYILYEVASAYSNTLYCHY